MLRRTTKKKLDKVTTSHSPFQIYLGSSYFDLIKIFERLNKEVNIFSPPQSTNVDTFAAEKNEFKW